MSSGLGSPDPYQYGQSNDQRPVGSYGQPTQTPPFQAGPYQGNPYQGNPYQGAAQGAPTQHGQPYPLQPGSYQSGPYVMPPEHPQGTTILVLGIVSLMVPVVGFVAWYMGRNAQREIDETGALYSNVGNITAGRIIGMITLILSIVGAAFFVIYFIFVMIIFAGAMSGMPG